MIKLGLKQLFKYNIHIGYSASRWNPRVAPFLYGIRNNVHIINLEYTTYMLRRASYFLSELIKLRGTILIINLKEGSYAYLYNRLKRLGQFNITNKYIGGLLTNFRNVKPNYNSLKYMNRIPSAVFVINLAQSPGIVQECKKLDLPLIGVMDSNVDPSYFTYPVPGNSEGLVSNKFFFNLLIKSIYAGILKRRFVFLKMRKKKRNVKR